MVHYNENIRPNGHPVELSLHSAGQHWLLMNSLINVIRMAAQNTTDCRPFDGGHIAAVADFLQDILPGEYQLKGGIESEEEWFERSKERDEKK